MLNYQKLSGELDRSNRSKDMSWEFEASMEVQHTLERLPHGSGIDRNWGILNCSNPSKRIVLDNSFHRMDNNGSYCGWLPFKVVITPSLWSVIEIRVTGCSKHPGVQDYLEETLRDYFLEEYRGMEGK
jgi:hypothetical protein